jgi:type I restriction enzyme R subunit
MAETSEKIVEAAQANSFSNFSHYFGPVLEELFIDRMEGNEAIFARAMSDQSFRDAAQEHIAREVYERIREQKVSSEAASTSMVGSGRRST